MLPKKMLRSLGVDLASVVDQSLGFGRAWTNIKRCGCFGHLPAWPQAHHHVGGRQWITGPFPQARVWSTATAASVQDLRPKRSLLGGNRANRSVFVRRSRANADLLSRPHLSVENPVGSGEKAPKRWSAHGQSSPVSNHPTPGATPVPHRPTRQRQHRVQP